MAWEKVVKKNADVNDTIELIVDTINKYSKSEYVQSTCNTVLKQSNGSLNLFLRKLFNLVCTKVKYQLDPINYERVTTPERLIRDGIGDCKKMSVFIASVLKCAGITPLLKVISYDGTNYEHIYVIVAKDGGYTTLDPVNNCKYNEEIPHAKARVLDLNNKEMPQLSLLGKPPQSWNQQSGYYINPYPSRFLNYLSGPQEILNNNSRFLNYLSGPVSAIDTDINSIAFNESKFIDDNFNLLSKYRPVGVSGAWDDFWAKAKATAKTIGLAPGRGAFLLLLKFNVFGLATKTKTAWGNPNFDGGQGIPRWWLSIGGSGDNDFGVLRSATDEGAKKSRLFGKQSLGEITIAAAITAATPVVASLLQLLKEKKVISQDQQDEISKTIVNNLPTAPTPTGQGEAEDEPKDEGMGTGTMLLLALGGVVAYKTLSK